MRSGALSEISHPPKAYSQRVTSRVAGRFGVLFALHCTDTCALLHMLNRHAAKPRAGQGKGVEVVRGEGGM